MPYGKGFLATEWQQKRVGSCSTLEHAHCHWRYDVWQQEFEVASWLRSGGCWPFWRALSSPDTFYSLVCGPNVTFQRSFTEEASSTIMRSKCAKREKVLRTTGQSNLADRMVDCSTGQSAVVWVQNQTLEAFVTASHSVYAKFGCPVAPPEFSTFGLAEHDC